jgi:hypothetical protein
MANVGFGGAELLLLEQLLRHEQVTLHLAQHHQHIEIGLNGNRVTGFSTFPAFPTLSALGELALFRMVQMLSAGLRRCH